MIESTVLVVDDAVAIVESLCEILERLGVPPENIVRADTAAGALERFREAKPGVVFLDMDLAGERGEDVALEILRTKPSTKVVVMTGMDPGDPRVRAAVSAGAFEVIEKPLRLARLRKTIEAIDTEERGLRRI